MKWGAANVFYVVAEPATVLVHELPACWVLHRISIAGTRAVNREHGVRFEDVERAS